jgi:hypothetical protein
MFDSTTDDDARSCSEVARDLNCLNDESDLENADDLKSGLFSNCFFDILTRSDQNLS